MRSNKFISRSFPRRFVLFVFTVGILILFVKNDFFPQEDSSKLIDLKDFKFLKTHRPCKELAKQPTVVVVIYTAPKNFLKRDLIRQTWGFKDPRALLIFLIGLVEDKQLQHEIDVENELHGDIVQGNFIDAYRNLTYKHVMAFKWMIYNCPGVPFLLKLDDDVFVNTPLLYDYLETPSEASAQLHTSRLVLGFVTHNGPVHRFNRSKWFVTMDEYTGTHYPDYCRGSAILYSSDVILPIYRQAKNLPFFWIEDVHMTGTITSKLNISLTSNSNFYEPIEKIFKFQERLPFVFTTPDLPGTTIRTLWTLVERNSSNRP